MSMHEFEELVEASIECLEQSALYQSTTLRSLFWNLYQFQAAWDTGFTHFRVMDTLQRHRFVYRFALSRHPDYLKHQALFESIDGFTFISTRPEAAWDRDTNPTAGYIDPPYLYCDAGSPLWQRFVDLGELTGSDALPPTEVPLVALVRDVVVAARQQHDVALISLWYTAMGVHCWSLCSDAEQQEVKRSLLLSEIRGIVKEIDALAMNPGTGFLEQPPSDLIADDPFLGWWFERD